MDGTDRGRGREGGGDMTGADVNSINWMDSGR